MMMLLAIIKLLQSRIQRLARWLSIPSHPCRSYKHQPPTNRKDHHCTSQKPEWLKQEIVRLKARMPQAGCRTIADICNRRFAASRQIIFGKTFVHEVLQRNQYEIQILRRNLKHATPKATPRNLIWGLDLTGKTDAHGKLHALLFDTSLYAHSTKTDNTSNPDFLELIVNHEAGFDPMTLATIEPDARVTRFTQDPWKLAQDGGLTMKECTGFSNWNKVSKTLIAFDMQKYYEEKEGSTGKDEALFSDVSGGGEIQFDTDAVVGEGNFITTAKGYNKYFTTSLDNTSFFAGAESALVKKTIGDTKDRYVQAAKGGMDGEDSGDRGALMLGGEETDTLTGGTGNDVLVGGKGDDTLKDGDGKDLLLGGDDQDTLEGEAGDDKLIGGNNADTLEGGADTDKTLDELGITGFNVGRTANKQTLTAEAQTLPDMQGSSKVRDLSEAASLLTAANAALFDNLFEREAA